MIERLKDGIYRIIFPFDEVTTSVFLLTQGKETIILDSGACDEDAEKYILPAVAELGLTPRYLVSSHTHCDHHGGINALKKAYPKAIAALFEQSIPDSYHLNDGELLLGRYRMLNVLGHSPDSLAVFDETTATLLSFDCLQQYGVGKFRSGIGDKSAYLASLDRVRRIAPKTIIASHEYDPLGSIAEGEAQINELLRVCAEAAKTI